MHRMIENKPDSKPTSDNQQSVNYVTTEYTDADLYIFIDILQDETQDIGSIRHHAYSGDPDDENDVRLEDRPLTPIRSMTRAEIAALYPSNPRPALTRPSQPNHMPLGTDSK
jgi:hypothetical protein